MILGYNKKYTKNKRILNANEMKNYKLYVKTLKQHYKRLTKNNLTIKEYLEKINE